MADKVYIPNLVVNEISDDLIDGIADRVSGSVDTTNLAKLNEANTFTQANTMPQVNTSAILSATKLDIASTTEVAMSLQLGQNNYRQINVSNPNGIQITSIDSDHVANATISAFGASLQFNEKSIDISNGHNDTSTPADIVISHSPTITNPTEWATMVDNEVPTKKQIVDIADTKVSKTGPETIEGVKTFSSIPLCSHRPTNGSQLANKDYVDSVAGGGDTLPLSISNQIATYDATTLNFVKWDFGTDTYSQLGTHDIDLVTKTSRLDKTSNVIIGDSGCYAIPDEIIPMFGDSMKEMGSIPIGLSVTHAGTNIGGLGIGGNSSASVLWGGNGRNFLAITTDQVTLMGSSTIGNAGFTIAGGGVVFHAPNSLNFNLGTNGTLTMSAKMISELKRLLGIQ